MYVFEEDTLEVKRRDRVKELVALPSEKTVGKEKGTEERRGRKGGGGGDEGAEERTGVWEWCAAFGPWGAFPSPKIRFRSPRGPSHDIDARRFGWGRFGWEAPWLGASAAEVDCVWGSHSAAALLEHMSLRIFGILFVGAKKLVSVEDTPSAPLRSAPGGR